MNMKRLTGRAKMALAAVALFGLMLGCTDDDDVKILHGNVDDRELQLAFVLAERVAKVVPEEGTTVKKGDLIAELETVRIDNEIAVAKAEVATRESLVKAAQARKDKSDHGERAEDISKQRDEAAALASKIVSAEKEMLRKQELVKTRAVSKQEADDAEAKYKALVNEHSAATNQLARLLAGDRAEDRAAIAASLDEAKANLLKAQAQLKVAEQKRIDCQLFAPGDGIIRERILEPGEFTAPMRPVIALALSNPKWVRCYLKETQLAKHKLNDKAKVKADGAKEPFEGWIGYISPTAEYTPKNIETDELRPTLVYETRIYVKDPEGLLKLGAPVVVELE